MRRRATTSPAALRVRLLPSYPSVSSSPSSFSSTSYSPLTLPVPFFSPQQHPPGSDDLFSEEQEKVLLISPPLLSPHPVL